MPALIDTVLDPKTRASAAKRCRERNIILPTFAQMRNPALIPDAIRAELRGIGLWDIHPRNLFRITWHNAPVEKGGGFGPVNYLVVPPELTGIRATVIALAGKWFPTGAHKVGAAYGCLAPRMITGQFDPARQKAVWPSTGNYCRGGAFDSTLMGCTAVAILPEGMSTERFDWLKTIGAEIIATPGGESNVKEIYDKCWEIRRTRPECVIFNQFDEFGNSCWHYHVTGPAIEEVWQSLPTPRRCLAAFTSSTGSAGTIAAGDYLRTKFPQIKIVASEALQCPTLLMNGFGEHRIEGIGDKHVPWIHNVKNTNIVTAIDDEKCVRLFRLFNEPAGTAFLAAQGVPRETVAQLPLLGFSGIANILSAIKTAKYLECTADDVIFTVATDSSALYLSRIEELRAARGSYSELQAARDWEFGLLSETTDHLKELTQADQHALHNLKYFTWVEQQGKTSEELNELWYDRDFWPKTFGQVAAWDDLIREFNELTGAARA